MSISADPAELNACQLDDYAAAWATRLMVPVARLSRRDGEADVYYRHRLVGMIQDLRR